MLIVGTSFLWSLMGAFERIGFYVERDFLFYNKTNYFFRGQRKGESRRGKETVPNSAAELHAILETRDAVIFETNEALVHEAGFGFLDAVSKLIKANGARAP